MGEKHVIFLGAGASASSGYPLVNDLRLLMSSRAHFKKSVQDAVNADIENPVEANNSDYWRPALEYFDSYEPSINLFRNGCFSSLDEFCKLARDSNEKHIVDKMRNLLAACLSIRNPERTFEESDYYPFIQTLFKQDELWSLRDEIAVLTYNYDPYLDYLLARALEYRRTAAQNPVRLTELWNSVTGGYYAPDNLEWLTDQKRPATFCLLKLHGSICYARPGVKDDHQVRFTADVRTRISRISRLEELEQHPLRPPVLFPWEIINSDGEFVPVGASVPGETSLYELNKLVWDRARREVQGATKVSFVGLSMHPFMNDGLKFLFKDKKGPLEVVAANEENKRWKANYGHPLVTSSPCGKVSGILKTICGTDLVCHLSSCDISRRMQVGPSSSAPVTGVTARDSFRDFIEWEMTPPGR